MLLISLSIFVMVIINNVLGVVYDGLNLYITGTMLLSNEQITKEFL